MGGFEVDLVDEIADAMCDDTEFELVGPPPKTERHKWVDAWRHAQVCIEAAAHAEELAESGWAADAARLMDRVEALRDEALETGTVCVGCWTAMGELVRAAPGLTIDEGLGPDPCCDDCHRDASAEAAALVGP